MKSARLLVATISLALLLPAHASSDAGQEHFSVWDRIKYKLSRIAPKKEVVHTTASSGVRGYILETDDLYWKGEEIVEMESQELLAFNKAMRKASVGDVSGALISFNSFIEHYPTNPLVDLVDDAKEAISNLILLIDKGVCYELSQ